jgi:hypothetical protein
MVPAAWFNRDAHQAESTEHAILPDRIKVVFLLRPNCRGGFLNLIWKTTSRSTKKTISFSGGLRIIESNLTHTDK